MMKDDRIEVTNRKLLRWLIQTWRDVEIQMWPNPTKGGGELFFFVCVFFSYLDLESRCKANFGKFGRFFVS